MTGPTGALSAEERALLRRELGYGSAWLHAATVRPLIERLLAYQENTQIAPGPLALPMLSETCEKCGRPY